MAGLRVIAGVAKGRKLKLVAGTTTRPISDRVKESLFDILGSDIEATAVLDLFAGTGSVGIEALSRGAAEAVFVESDRRAVEVIRENLRLTGLAAQGRVVRTDVFIYLRNTPPQSFGYIHIAPPQYHELWIRTLHFLEARPEWLLPEGVAVVQIHPGEYQPLELHHLELVDQRRYGSTMLCFYERCGE